MDMTDLKMMTTALQDVSERLHGKEALSSVFDVANTVVALYVNKRSSGFWRAFEYWVCRGVRRARIVIRSLLGAYWFEQNRSRAICMAMRRGKTCFVYNPTPRDLHARDWGIFWS